jgi:RNA recognition motif-containing protein
MGKKLQNENKDSCKIFINGLSKNTTEVGLYNSFSECGEILNLFLNFFEDTGAPKFAIISFKHLESAKKAIEYNGTYFDHSKIKIQFAKNQKNKFSKNDHKKIQINQMEKETKKPKNQGIQFDFIKEKREEKFVIEKLEITKEKNKEKTEKQRIKEKKVEIKKETEIEPKVCKKRKLEDSNKEKSKKQKFENKFDPKKKKLLNLKEKEICKQL